MFGSNTFSQTPKNPNQQTSPFFSGTQNPLQGQSTLFGGGNMFGGGTTQNTTQGGGIFGGGGGNATTPTFGQPNNNMGQPGLFNGVQAPPQTTTPTFGTLSPTTGTGIFGGTSNTGGLFGNNSSNSAFKTQPTTFTSTLNTGSFSNSSTFPNTTGSNISNPNNSIFGQNNANNAGMNNSAFNKNNNATFGTTNNTFGNNTGAGLFGNTSNTAIGGMFNSNTPQNNNTLFGNANSNTNTMFNNNSAMKTNTGGTLFGANTTSLFGNTTTSGGAIFGGNNNQSTGTGLFGSFNKMTTTAPMGTNNMTPTQNTFNFSNNTLGNAPQNNNNIFGSNFNNNSLGNTTWGVPTNTLNISKFTPLKPRNTKIDGKHVVKCITLLDQNFNFCKNQLRIRFIQSGGQQAPNAFMMNNTQNTGGQLFGNNMNNNSNNMFTGKTNNTGIAGNTGSIFGQNNSNQTFFNQNSNTNQSNGLFGNMTNNQSSTGGSLFGNNTNNNAFKPATGGIFGNNTTSTSGTFGNISAAPFGTQPSTGLFGTPNNNTVPTFSFGNSNNNMGSLGNMGNMGGGLFATPAAPAFANTTTSQPLFGNPNPQSSFQMAPQQQPGFMPTHSYPNAFAQPITNCLAPNQQIMDYNQMMSASLAPIQAGQYGFYPNANNSAMLAASFLNGLFNSNLIQKYTDINPNNPFEQLVTDVKKKNASNPFDTVQQYGSSYTNSDPTAQYTNSSKYNKTMINNPVSFNQSPYLYTDSYLPECNNSPFVSQRFKLMKVPQKFEPEPIKFKETENILPKNLTNNTPVNKMQNLASVQKRILANQDDLPIVDCNVVLSPSVIQLKGKSVQQLKNVQNVSIQNQYGKIQFKQPINLHHKKLSQCIEILQDSIEIIEEQWQKKQCDLYFYNFGHYLDYNDEDERNKIEKKMKKWIQKNNMRQVNFDKNNGLLHVEVF